MTTEIIGTYTSSKGTTITVSFESDLGLTVRDNGRVAGFALEVWLAQDIVNRLCGSAVWVD
jgi:hypothetical protein